MNKKTILVVDDSKVSRMLIKCIINDVEPNWIIVESANGDEALKVTESLEIDLMILDYNMPGIDGLTLAKELKERFPDSSISLLTANIQSATENKARDLGVDFVKKPITEEKIKGILARVK